MMIGDWVPSAAQTRAEIRLQRALEQVKVWGGDSRLKATRLHRERVKFNLTYPVPGLLQLVVFGIIAFVMSQDLFEYAIPSAVLVLCLLCLAVASAFFGHLHDGGADYERIPFSLKASHTWRVLMCSPGAQAVFKALLEQGVEPHWVHVNLMEALYRAELADGLFTESEGALRLDRDVNS